MKLSFASKYMYHTATVKGGFSIRPVLFCGEIPKAYEDALTSLGYEVRRLPPFSALDFPVASHPDILFCQLPSGKLLTSRHYLQEHSAFFAPLSSHLVPCDSRPQSPYPTDTVFNAFAIGSTLFGGKALANELTRYYPDIVTVPQGYTHCSAAIVGSGVITQDKPLYHALLQKGVHALLISSGAIRLPPYDTGFIGGASITLSDTLTVFFGKIEDHPDYPAMAAFAQSENATLLSLTNTPLADYGGGYLLNRYESEIKTQNTESQA